MNNNYYDNMGAQYAEDDTASGDGIKRSLPIIIPGIILVVLAVLFATGVFGGKTGSVKYYGIDSENVSDMEVAGSSLVVLTNNKTIYLSKNGREVSTEQFSYKNPALKVNGSNVLVFDRGGTDLRLEQNRGIVYSYSSPYKITAAAVGKSSVVAFACDSVKNSFARSSVFVKKTKSAEPVPVYKSEDCYCVALAVSDDGDYIAADIIGSQNGALISTVLIIEAETQDVIAEKVFEGSNVLSLDFIKANALFVLTDSNAGCLSKDGFELYGLIDTSEMLSYYNGAQTLTSVVSSLKGNRFTPVISIYNDSQLEGTVNLDEEVQLITTSKNYVAAVTGKKICVYNTIGELCGEAEICDDCVNIAISNRAIYTLLPGGIYISGIKTADKEGNVLLIGEKEEETTVLVVDMPADDIVETDSQENVTTEQNSEDTTAADVQEDTTVSVEQTESSFSDYLADNQTENEIVFGTTSESENN